MIDGLSRPNRVSSHLDRVHNPISREELPQVWLWRVVAAFKVEDRTGRHHVKCADQQSQVSRRWQLHSVFA